MPCGGATGSLASILSLLLGKGREIVDLLDSSGKLVFWENIGQSRAPAAYPVGGGI
jgi:hypothetical protein